MQQACCAAHPQSGHHWQFGFPTTVTSWRAWCRRCCSQFQVPTAPFSPEPLQAADTIRQLSSQLALYRKTVETASSPNLEVCVKFQSDGIEIGRISNHTRISRVSCITLSLAARDSCKPQQLLMAAPYHPSGC